VVPSVVAQRIIVKFLTNKSVKPAEIQIRLRTQIGDETFSRTQVYDWSKSFKKGRTEVEKIRRLHLLQRKLWPVILKLLRHLIHRLSDIIMNHQHSLLYQSS